MRPYHSPSSQKLGDRCPRAWAYCYLDGIRSPDTDANRVGLAIHAAFEAYWSAPGEAGPIPPGKVGQIVLDGLRQLPPKVDCDIIRVESPVGNVDIPGAAPDARVRQAIDVNGVLWAGFRDLLLRPSLGLPIVVDYKSCGSFRFMLDPPGLARDLQGCIYAHDACTDYHLVGVDLRWLYLATGARRESRPVAVWVPAARALDVLSRASERARVLDLIPDSASAPCNPAACGDYGGCFYHHDRGGPCHPPTANAQKRGKPMTSATATSKIAELKARFEAKKAAAAAAEAEPEEVFDAVEATASEHEDGDTAVEVVEAPKPRAAISPGRVIGGKSTAPGVEVVDVSEAGPDPLPSPAGTLADAIADQLGKIRAAEAVIVQCKARLRGLLA